MTQNHQDPEVQRQNPNGDPIESESDSDQETMKSNDPVEVLEEERQKAERYLTNWQRAQADLVNYRRRVEQEKAETAKYGNAALLRKMLPALDDLERAIENAPPEIASTPWFEGLRLAERKFLNALESEGVTVVDQVGQPFDPRFEEAVFYGPGPEGIVTGVLQKGFRYDDRVLRPALVRVGNGEAAGEGEPQ